MKTSPSAIRLVRIRVLLVAAVFAIIGGLEFHVGGTAVARIGHASRLQTDDAPAPNLQFWDFVAATR